MGVVSVITTKGPALRAWAKGIEQRVEIALGEDAVALSVTSGPVDIALNGHGFPSLATRA